jgi:peptidoglycan/xylan/chitin deacetylase (PgdA/CDA1 family)
MTGVPILMYHALEDAEHPAVTVAASERRYVMQAAEFREQMMFLRERGIRPLLFDEILSGHKIPPNGAVITFDDGHASNCTVALGILKEFGFRAEFFVTSGWIGTPGYLTEEQIRTLSRAGMGIGSHGVSHAYFTDLDAAALDKELVESRAVLSGIIGREINLVSAPGGRIDDVGICRAIAHGYRAVCTSRPRLFRDRGSEHQIPRFAVTAGDSATYQAIVEKRGASLALLTARYHVLHWAKRLIGNKRYETVRGVLLGA